MTQPPPKPNASTPIDPSAKDRCAHDMRYRLVRSYDLSRIDTEGVAINWCDYCGADLGKAKP